MGEVYFKPWVGPDYYEGGVFNYRILAVGDSHYCSDPCSLRDQGKCGIAGNVSLEEMGECRDFTVNIVKQYINNVGNPLGRWTGTYTKFTRVLSGGRESQIDVKHVWNSIAFYNFVQSNIQVGPGQNMMSFLFKGQNLYSDSIAAFNSIVEDLQPDFIIVWGNNVWNTIKSSSTVKCLEFWETNQSPAYLKKPRNESKSFLKKLFSKSKNHNSDYSSLPIAMKITHPCSSKFSYENYNSMFSNFLRPSL